MTQERCMNGYQPCVMILFNGSVSHQGESKIPACYYVNVYGTCTQYITFIVIHSFTHGIVFRISCSTLHNYIMYICACTGLLYLH
jgi:hypothetical protein